jgi:predicted aldo/keto reductase-like oxidoreductase
MRYRLFGPTGLRVSELFLGAMTFGEQGGVGAPPEECARILNTYAEAGGNVVDTAINYRGGQSEEILAHLLLGRRDRFVLSAWPSSCMCGRGRSLSSGSPRCIWGLRRFLLRSQLAATRPPTA